MKKTDMKPKTIKILGFTYRVHVCDQSQFPEGFRDNNVGHVHHDTNDIYISTKCSRENQISILIHEVVHTISSKQGLNLTEETVIRLETGLFSFFSDNDFQPFKVFDDDEPSL